MAAAREIYGNGCTSVSDLRVQKGAGSSKSNPPDTRFTGKPRVASPALCFFVLLLFLSVIDAWGACGIFYANPSHDCSSMSSSQTAIYSVSQCANSVTGSCRWGTTKPNGTLLVNGGGGSRFCTSVSAANYCCQGNLTISYCDNECEADSVANGGIILECQYVA